MIECALQPTVGRLLLVGFSHIVCLLYWGMVTDWLNSAFLLTTVWNGFFLVESGVFTVLLIVTTAGGLLLIG